MAISIAQAILDGANRLRQSGVPDERREAGSLLMHLLDRNRTYIIAHADDELSDDQVENLSRLIEERGQGKPLQYITGHQEFFGLDFEVNSDVLIPRPETELLVEAALSLVSANESGLVGDVGTGSGCILISLLTKLTNWQGIALDISEAALVVAKRNALRHDVQGRVEFKISDCLQNLESSAGLLFDLIVSNPPYVAESVIAGLQREVRDFEPRVALTAGEDGLSIIKRLLLQCPNYLKNGGLFLFEMGFDQSEKVRRLIDSNQWKLLDIYPDLQGIPRIVALQKAE